MTLTQFTGDSITHAIPLRWQGSDFEPGTEWLLLWTAKADASNADVDALIQKASGYGITADGSVASVALVPEDTVEITTKTLLWDIQAQHEGTGEVRTVASGNLRLTRDITREITPSIPINTTEPPVPMGPAGPAPVITVGTVTTGAPGSQAAVEITGTAPNYTLNVTIPAGLDGTNGTDADVTAASVLAAAQEMTTPQEAGMREVIQAQSRAIGFMDRFDRSDRYAPGSTITHLAGMPEIGASAYRIVANGPAPTIVNGAWECSGDSLYYLSNRVATPSGRFSLGVVVEFVRTSVYATALNNGGFNISISEQPIALDDGSISGLTGKAPIHINIATTGITSATLYPSTNLTCLNRTAAFGVYPWNDDQQDLPLRQKVAILVRVEGDIIEVEAVGIGTIMFTHPDVSTKIGATDTYFWYEPNGPLLGTDYRTVSRLYRWWAMAEALDQLPGYGMTFGMPSGNVRVAGQLRLYPNGQTSKVALNTLAGTSTGALYGGAAGTVAKGTYNRFSGGEAIFEGLVSHDYGFANVGASIQGFMVGATDSNLNTPTSSAAGAETDISGGGFVPAWALENADWERWFFAGTLVGAGAKRIRLFAQYVTSGTPGDIIDSNAAGTPLNGLTGFWTLEVTRYTTSTVSNIFYAELKANGVLVAAKRTTANHTTNYYAGNIKTTTADAGGVTLDTAIRQIARVNVT